MLEARNKETPMLKRLAILALAAIVSAAYIAPNVLAGDDPEKMKEKREKVREKYKDKNEGFPFYDLVYWVDAAKLEDSRWSMSLPPDPDHIGGYQLFANWTNEASAAEGMTIVVRCLKLVHKRRNEQGTFNNMQVPFNNLGESVMSSDMDGILDGFYEDWKRGAKDVLEDKCEAPKKSKHKIPKKQAAAVGTDPESNQRIRKEWYVWTHGGELSTYVLMIEYGPALFDKEGLVEKGQDLVKNLKEIKDKVEWPDE